MKCTVCGAGMNPITTDLPFKLSEERIIIFKQLPVLQCGACREYLIEDTVMARIDAMLGQVDSTVQLEVIRYVAGESLPI
jgi:YgiT-type zinc finger domain-containing protein